MKDISPILKSLGLLDSEVKTYLKALENGPGTVLDLAKQTGLSRQAVYVAINALTERGLMSSALRGKKRFYAAEHPSKLIAYATRHEDEVRTHIDDLERILPELELQIGGERPVVRVFEGKEGLRAIIEELQSTKSKVSHELSDLKAMYQVLTEEDLKQYRLKSKKAGTHVKGLYAGTPSAKITSSDRIFLPKELSGFKSNIGIYGDKIAPVTFEGKMYSVLIESSALRKAFGVLFELALKGAREFPKE